MVRWPKFIQVFAIIIAIALSGRSIAYDHIVQTFHLSSAVKADDATIAKKDYKTTVGKAAPEENYYLKTPRQTSVSARSEERDFSNALFISFFNHTKLTISEVTRRNINLQFVSIGLKIIYPYHYFW